MSPHNGTFGFVAEVKLRHSVAIQASARSMPSSRAHVTLVTTPEAAGAQALSREGQFRPGGG